MAIAMAMAMAVGVVMAIAMAMVVGVALALAVAMAMAVGVVMALAMAMAIAMAMAVGVVMFNFFIENESCINFVCAAFMMISLCFSSDSQHPNKLDMFLAGLTFLAYSGLLLNTVANILEKGF